MDGGRKREVDEDYAGGVISPFSSFRTREKEGERESEINAVTPQCCHMLFHFLPSGRREVSRRGYRVRLRETSCRDLGRRTMGVMEVTKEANSNDRATIEPPPRSIGRRHWFPPVYQLHRSFLLFFFFLLLLLFFLLFDEWTSNAVGKLVIQGEGWRWGWETFAGD